MVDFRRLITAIAGAALFAGVAAAQVNVSCATNQGGVGTVAKNIRSEGFTELTGDMVFACTGGTVPTTGNVPTANITVFVNTQVTSRLLGSGGLSEAELLVDEPNGAVNPGGAAPRTDEVVCATAPSAGGCPITVANYGTATTANIFQGYVSGNTVTFYGVPIMPTGTTGTYRYFRITNLRVNATGVGGTANVPGTVTASVSSNTFAVANPTQTVAFATPGLSANSGVTGASTYPQCVGAAIAPSAGGTVTSAPSATLNFTEGFATAFQPRFAGVAQYFPGQTYNAESGFIANPVITGAAPALPAGIADWGTRLKVNFSNIPAGVTVYVPTINYALGNATTIGYAANDNAPGHAPVGTPIALLVASETATDAYSATANVYTNTITAATAGTWTNFVALNTAGGTATATWEVVSTNPTALDTLSFPVLVAFAANQSATSPLTGAMTASLSLAPNPTNGAFTAAAGPTQLATLIPRFADTGTSKTAVTFSLCSTSLLFPFVTSIGGFDTGIAIANTSKDPFGTVGQAGQCTLNFYGQNAPTTAPTLPAATGSVIQPGDTTPTDFTALASTIAPNFEGYMIAVCNFQYAHGFAFVSDLGAQKLAMGYIAEVISGSTSGAPAARKTSGAEQLGR